MGSLSACSAGAPDPAPSADALASAMNSGDFSGVQFAGSNAEEAAKALETAFGSMGEIKHTSTVSSAAEDEEEQDGVKTATANITTVWDVDKSDKDLSYDTQAVWEFDSEAEAWKLRLDPAIFAPEFESGDYLKASFEPAARGNITDAEGASIVTFCIGEGDCAGEVYADNPQSRAVQIDQGGWLARALAFLRPGLDDVGPVEQFGYQL